MNWTIELLWLADIMLPGGLCCCWDWGHIWPTIVQCSLTIWSQSIDANLHKSWVKRRSCCDFQDWSRSCLSWCVIPLMHFSDIALKWNMNLQNEISPFPSLNVKHSSVGFCITTMRMQPSHSIFQIEKKKSFIAFFRYGVSERRVSKTNASTPQLQALRRNHATDENIPLSPIQIFHISLSCSGEGDEGADCVLTVWLCRECGCFSFSFLWRRTNSFSSVIIFNGYCVWGEKREVVFFCWFVEHKENTRVQS